MDCPPKWPRNPSVLGRFLQAAYLSPCALTACTCPSCRIVSCWVFSVHSSFLPHKLLLLGGHQEATVALLRSRALTRRRGWRGDLPVHVQLRGSCSCVHRSPDSDLAYHPSLIHTTKMTWPLWNMKIVIKNEFTWAA